MLATRFVLTAVLMAGCGRLYFERAVVDGSSTDGSSADGSSADGSSVDGSSVDGSMSFGCASVTQIPVLECAALVDFFQRAGGPSWTNMQGWLTNADPCAWLGVTCAAGHVTGVEVRDSALTGSLSVMLGNLTELERFAAASPEPVNTTLGGIIPGELFSIQSLMELDLSGNRLTGNIPDVPNGGAMMLTTVDLSNNQLSGSIPAMWSTLSSLQTLDASDNQLSGSLDHLASAIALERLDLHHNAFASSLPSAFAGLVALRELDLSGNQFNASLVSFSAPVGLQTLLINDNDLAGLVPRCACEAKGGVSPRTW